MKISTILATKGMNVITARPELTLRDAIALLVKHNIGALVVVDEAGRPVGMFSERDFIRVAAQSEQVLSRTVGEVMTRNVITALPSDDVKSVEQTMTDRRIRHLPILDQGKLAGIVSIGDLVKAQLDAYAGEIDTLQTQIIKG